MIISIPLGVVVSLGLLSKFSPLRWILKFYVWLMRGTPLLLQLIFVFLWVTDYWCDLPAVRCRNLCLCIELHGLLRRNLPRRLSGNS
ncbi:ABC transporter permease subunit [Secundilactobacillus collinoides]|uniref:ABC transporter permease subunit n=1 Tax=Secundilactobacillus collinoides TaxID=33960 RepID=UPI0034E1E96D